MHTTHRKKMGKNILILLRIQKKQQKQRKGSQKIKKNPNILKQKFSVTALTKQFTFIGMGLKRIQKMNIGKKERKIINIQLGYSLLEDIILATIKLFYQKIFNLKRIYPLTNYDSQETRRQSRDHQRKTKNTSQRQTNLTYNKMIKGVHSQPMRAKNTSLNQIIPTQEKRTKSMKNRSLKLR